MKLARVLDTNKCICLRTEGMIKTAMTTTYHLAKLDFCFLAGKAHNGSPSTASRLKALAEL
jgi:hypothetical protein